MSCSSVGVAGWVASVIELLGMEFAPVFTNCNAARGEKVPRSKEKQRVKSELPGKRSSGGAAIEEGHDVSCPYGKVDFVVQLRIDALGGIAWQWDTEAAPEVAGWEKENCRPENEGWPIADEEDRECRKRCNQVREAGGSRFADRSEEQTS